MNIYMFKCRVIKCLGPLKAQHCMQKVTHSMLNMHHGQHIQRQRADTLDSSVLCCTTAHLCPDSATCFTNWANRPNGAWTNVHMHAIKTPSVHQFAYMCTQIDIKAWTQMCMQKHIMHALGKQSGENCFRTIPTVAGEQYQAEIGNKTFP